MTLQEAKDFIENNVQIDIRYCSDEEVNKTKEAFEIAMAAIERFQKIESTINSFLNELQKMTMFKDKETPTLEELMEYIDNRKTEACKELAEKLNERFKVLEYMPKTQRKTLPVVVVKQQVDGLLQNGCPHIVNKVLNEMVGETNGKNDDRES